MRTVNAYGKSSISGEAMELPLYPGIHVDGYGILSFPLGKVTTETFIKATSEHTEKRINCEDENMHEIDASCIQIKNPIWNEGLNKLLERIVDELGCYREISAKLNKLSIFKPGSGLKRHKETSTEKSNQMGYLIIQLPSDYEGGELIVHNNDMTSTIHDFGIKNSKAPYSIQFAVYLSEVEHEISEVKGGYRLALVYSLFWKTESEDEIINHRDRVSVLSSCLNSLSNEPKCRFAFLLENNDYTDESLHEDGAKVLRGIYYAKIK